MIFEQNDLDSHKFLNFLTKRCSIRNFLDSVIDAKVIKKIVQAGQRAPVAGEFYSIIWVRDPKKREKLSYVRKSPPILLIICVDFRKAKRILNLRDRELLDIPSWLFLWGMIDACLMLQNMITACEVIGLGSVLMGGIPRAMEKVCKVLKIPEKVFPIIGLGIGYPAEAPLLRPRYPLSSVLFTDDYRDLTEEEIKNIIDYMNEEREKEGYYKKYGQMGENGIELEHDLKKYTWQKHFYNKFAMSDKSADEIKQFWRAMEKQGFSTKLYYK